MRESKHWGVWVRQKAYFLWLEAGYILVLHVSDTMNTLFTDAKNHRILHKQPPSSQVLCQPRESFTTAAVIIQNVSFYSFLERCHRFSFSDAMECICISSSGGWSLPLSITRNRKNSRFLLIMMTIGFLPPIRSHDLWWHKL